MKDKIMSKHVNVYRIGTSYGGPEEGGWYYNFGEAVASIPVDLSDEEFEQARLGAAICGILVATGDVPEYDLTAHHMGAEHVHIEGFCDEDGWKCHEARWAKFLSDFITSKCEAIAVEWRKTHPRTGRSTSVLGGDDFSVVIEDKFAANWDDYAPYS